MQMAKLDFQTRYFEDLAIGMRETLRKTVENADVIGFAELSGDHNPVHLSDHFARKTRFGRRIVHGLYTASLISAVIGMRLPGPGAVYITHRCVLRPGEDRRRRRRQRRSRRTVGKGPARATALRMFGRWQAGAQRRGRAQRSAEPQIRRRALTLARRRSAFTLAIDPARAPRTRTSGLCDRQFRRRAPRPPRRADARQRARRGARRAERRADLRTASGRLFRRAPGGVPAHAPRAQGARSAIPRAERRGRPFLRRGFGRIDGAGIRRTRAGRPAQGSAARSWLGFPFRQGAQGLAGVSRRGGGAASFPVEIVEKVETREAGGAEAVSSSAIRRALERGDVEHAARGLGRAYAVSGVVAPGQKLGRALGVPTANIAVEPTNRLAYGVYAVRARVGGRAYDGVASFGVRPTVNPGAPLAGDPSVRFRRRTLRPGNGGGVRRAHPRRAQIRLARGVAGGNGARHRKGLRAVMAP